MFSVKTTAFKSNQIKSLLLSHHYSTSALVSEILMSVLQTVQKKQQQQFTYGQTVQKNNKQFTYGQTVQKNNNNNLHMDRQCKKQQQTIYIWTDSAKKQQTIYIWTDSAKKQQTIYIWTDSAKKLHWSIYSAPDSAKKQQQFTYGQYIFTDCTEDNVQNTHTYTQYTVYYKDTLNYQRHIIHRMGTSALCTVSIHNVVYT